MGDELLRADSVEIAGLRQLVDRIGQETLASHRYIGDHAGLSDTIPGQILQRLVPFIASYQEYKSLVTCTWLRTAVTSATS